MISFVMVVGHILSDRTSQVAVTARDQSVQALELDGPNEALGMRVTVRSAGGRLANVHTGGAQEREYRAAPFSIAITNQYSARMESTIGVIGQLPHDLQHEGFVWMVEPTMCTRLDSSSITNRV